MAKSELKNDKLQPPPSQFVLYQDDNGITNVNVRFDGRDVWLSQQQIALLFDPTRENVVQHIRTCKNFLQVQMEMEGTRSVRRNTGNRPLLHHTGTVSHEQAIEKATQEFEMYRSKEMLHYESDFDRVIKKLKTQADKGI